MNCFKSNTAYARSICMENFQYEYLHMKGFKNLYLAIYCFLHTHIIIMAMLYILGLLRERLRVTLLAIQKKFSEIRAFCLYVSRGLFTSNSLQCALKRIRIECASNPDLIHFGTFHITKMQCALSKRIITQSALYVLYIESNSTSQRHDAPGYFKIVLVFCLSVIRLHYEHKLARERRKYMAKKRKRRKLFLNKETAVP